MKRVSREINAISAGDILLKHILKQQRSPFHCGLNISLIFFLLQLRRFWKAWRTAGFRPTTLQPTSCWTSRSSCLSSTQSTAEACSSTWWRRLWETWVRFIHLILTHGLKRLKLTLVLFLFWFVWQLKTRTRNRLSIRRGKQQLI